MPTVGDDSVDKDIISVSASMTQVVDQFSPGAHTACVSNVVNSDQKVVQIGNSVPNSNNMVSSTISGIDLGNVAGQLFDFGPVLSDGSTGLLGNVCVSLILAYALLVCNSMESQVLGSSGWPPPRVSVCKSVMPLKELVSDSKQALKFQHCAFVVSVDVNFGNTRLLCSGYFYLACCDECLTNMKYDTSAFKRVVELATVEVPLIYPCFLETTTDMVDEPPLTRTVDSTPFSIPSVLHQDVNSQPCEDEAVDDALGLSAINVGVEDAKQVAQILLCQFAPNDIQPMRDRTFQDFASGLSQKLCFCFQCFDPGIMFFMLLVPLHGNDHHTYKLHGYMYLDRGDHKTSWQCSYAYDSHCSVVSYSSILPTDVMVDAMDIDISTLSLTRDTNGCLNSHGFLHGINDGVLMEALCSTLLALSKVSTGSFMVNKFHILVGSTNHLSVRDVLVNGIGFIMDRQLWTIMDWFHYVIQWPTRTSSSAYYLRSDAEYCWSSGGSIIQNDSRATVSYDVTTPNTNEKWFPLLFQVWQYFLSKCMSCSRVHIMAPTFFHLVFASSPIRHFASPSWTLQLQNYSDQIMPPTLLTVPDLVPYCSMCAWVALIRLSVGSMEFLILLLAYYHFAAALCLLASIYVWPPSLILFSFQEFGGLPRWDTFTPQNTEFLALVKCCGLITSVCHNLFMLSCLTCFAVAVGYILCLVMISLAAYINETHIILRPYNCLTWAKGKKAFLAGIADDNGYGWAIAKSLVQLVLKFLLVHGCLPSKSLRAVCIVVNLMHHECSFLC